MTIQTLTFRNQLFINGTWRDASSGKTFITYNPATGMPLTEVAEAGVTDVDEAVQAAEAAFYGGWRDLAADERGEILYRIADALENYREELGLLDTLDAGRPIRDTLNKDVTRAIKTFRFFAGMTDKIRGAHIPVQPPLVNYTRKEPYGVVVAITPWNYPLNNAVTKIAPILACGNTMVLKPAEQTSLSALKLAEICKEAGLPDGVLNVITGGSEAGEALSIHPKIRKVAFTGSTSVGKKIVENSKYGLKSYTLELGGKSPNIVFADADLEQAAEASVFSICMNQGQTCTAGTRLLVEENIAETFVQLLIEKAKKLRIGDPLDPSTQIGSLISKEQYERVKSYIQLGVAEGAKLVYGGIKPPECTEGYFLLPSIFTGIKNDMRIAQEEIFGPVLSIITFRDEQEAISLANDTSFGLAAAVWTKDLQRAHRLSDKVEAGLIWVNTIHTLSPSSPYGGYKESGTGLEMGLEAADQYMKTKSVWINTGNWVSPFSI
ncbi:aldehyde dehydrogenase family protein [Aneurinibacillus terranovensis]|uniref:aldehyde dehydrogenase family protein n=1 Tax=Aneurinibacillus terranovensis TaxID=278991 RepID=UPI0003F5D617|nr:aldehyde dehydrogenase [Aneurinibacillus terranovensis]